MEHIIYFKDLSNYQIRKFETLCDKWNDIFSKGDAPEEEMGNILSVIGQTKLLIKEKFKQFHDLIESCEKNDPTQKITSNDLQGFWDLLSLQIEDINNKFTRLELKEANKWKPMMENVTKISNIPVKKKTQKNKINEESYKESKQRLLAAKTAMKEKLKIDKSQGNYFV